MHVATRSAGSPAPLWAVEGLAEYVALASHPGERADELAALRSAPLPSRLPGDSAFTASGKDVTAAYAAAWLACSAVAEHRDRTALGRFYGALDPGPARRCGRALDARRRSAHGRAVVARRPGARRGRAGLIRPVPTTLVVTNDFPPAHRRDRVLRRPACRLLDDDVVVLASGPPGAAATDRDRPYPVVRDGGLLLPTPGVARRAADLLRAHGASRVLLGAAMPLGLLAPGCAGPGPRRSSP